MRRLKLFESFDQRDGKEEWLEELVSKAFPGYAAEMNSSQPGTYWVDSDAESVWVDIFVTPNEFKDHDDRISSNYDAYVEDLVGDMNPGQLEYDLEVSVTPPNRIIVTINDDQFER